MASEADSSTKKTPTKFGTQAEKSKVVTIFRNADKHHQGHTVTIKPKLTFEQVTSDRYFVNFN